MGIRKLSRILNLELAWKRVKNDQYNDLIPDVIELRDVDCDIKEALANLRHQIDSGYVPSDHLEIDVPKKGYTLRPGCTMIPEDRILYQATIDFISKTVESPPEEAVYSYQLRKDRYYKSMFKHWKPLWLKMREEMRRLYNEGFICLLRTDIAAYFEHIDHSILKENILNIEVNDSRFINLLDKLLRKWAISETRHIGIPQGCDASSYIGNIYLRDIDTLMLRNGYKYFRYSDEIYVLTKTEREAREAIKVLTHQLRSLHLNLQDAKTDIITEPDRLAEEFGTKEDDRIKDIDYEFGTKPKKVKKLVQDKVYRQYKSITKNGRAKTKAIDISKLRWCLNKLHSIGSDKAVNFILNRLANFAFMSDLIFRYLSLFVNRKYVKDRIVVFLSSNDNIYEWQEMWLLFTLSKARRLAKVHLDYIRSVVMNPEKHWACKIAAILAIGRLGDNTDKKWLRDLYRKETNHNIKRAIAIAVHGLTKSARNKFYAEIENDSYNMKRCIKYLRQDNIVTI